MTQPSTTISPHHERALHRLAAERIAGLPPGWTAVGDPEISGETIELRLVHRDHAEIDLCVVARLRVGALSEYVVVAKDDHAHDGDCWAAAARTYVGLAELLDDDEDDTWQRMQEFAERLRNDPDWRIVHRGFDGRVGFATVARRVPGDVDHLIDVTMRHGVPDRFTLDGMGVRSWKDAVALWHAAQRVAAREEVAS